MNSTSPAPQSASASLPHSACLGLGSNTDPARHLRAAVDRLRETLVVETVSGAWQSPAYGCAAPDYVNAALLVRTDLSLVELAALLKRTEQDLGRTPGRESLLVPIDIDLLVYDGVVQRADLWDLAFRAVTVGQLLPDLRSTEASESLAAASRRLAARTRITPRADIL